MERQEQDTQETKIKDDRQVSIHRNHWTTRSCDPERSARTVCTLATLARMKLAEASWQDSSDFPGRLGSPLETQCSLAFRVCGRTKHRV